MNVPNKSKLKRKIFFSTSLLAMATLFIGFQNCSKKENSTPATAQKQQQQQQQSTPFNNNDNCTDCNKDVTDVKSGSISGYFSTLINLILPAAAQAQEMPGGSTAGSSSTEGDSATLPTPVCKSKCDSTTCVDMYKFNGSSLELFCRTNVVTNPAGSNNLYYKFNIDNMEGLKNQFVYIEAKLPATSTQAERSRLFAGLYTEQNQIANIDVDTSLSALFMKKSVERDAASFVESKDDHTAPYTSQLIKYNSVRLRAYLKVRKLFYNNETGLTITLPKLFETSHSDIKNNLVTDTVYDLLTTDLDKLDPIDPDSTSETTVDEEAMAELAAANPLPSTHPLSNLNVDFFAKLDSDGDGTQDYSDCAPNNKNKWRLKELHLAEKDKDCYLTSFNMCFGTLAEETDFLNTHPEFKATTKCTDPGLMASCVVENNDSKALLMDDTRPSGSYIILRHNEYFKYQYFQYPVVNNLFVINETNTTYSKRACINGNMETTATPMDSTKNWPYDTALKLYSDTITPKYYTLTSPTAAAKSISSPTSWQNGKDTEGLYLLKTRQVTKKSTSVTTTCSAEHFAAGSCWYETNFAVYSVDGQTPFRAVALRQWQPEKGIKDLYIGINNGKLYYLESDKTVVVSAESLATSNGYYNYKLKQYDLATKTAKVLGEYNLNTKSGNVNSFVDTGGLVLMYTASDNKKFVKYFNSSAAFAENTVPDADARKISPYLRGFKNGKIDFIKIIGSLSPTNTRINLLTSYDVDKKTFVSPFNPVYPSAEETNFAAKAEEYFNLHYFKKYDFGNDKSLLLTRSKNEPYTMALYAFDRNATNPIDTTIKSKLAMSSFKGELLMTKAGVFSVKDDVLYKYVISGTNSINILPVAKISGLSDFTQFFNSTSPEAEFKILSRTIGSGQEYVFVSIICSPYGLHYSTHCDEYNIKKEKLRSFLVPTDKIINSPTGTPPTLELKNLGDINVNISDYIETLWRVNDRYFALTAKGYYNGGSIFNTHQLLEFKP